MALSMDIIVYSFISSINVRSLIMPILTNFIILSAYNYYFIALFTDLFAEKDIDLLPLHTNCQNTAALLLFENNKF
jgi:hypothetical protein